MPEKQQTLFAPHVSNSNAKNIKPKTVCGWKIFIDGAARGNPGKAGAGIYIVDQHNKIISKEGFYLGEKTNNQAEYLALAIATALITKLTNNDTTDIVFNFVSDSLLLVKQMKGEYKVKNPILSNIKQVVAKSLAQHNHSFTHVLRDQNKMADKLANQGIDHRRSLSPFLQRFVQKHRLPSIP